MPAPVVWFNKYLSNTWEVFAQLRAERRPGEFIVHCTHPNPRYAGRFHADTFEPEPGGLGESDYVQFALTYARTHSVTLMVPGRKLRPIAWAANQFAANGTKLLTAASAANLETLNHKGHVYAALAGCGIRIPEYAIVNDLAEFDSAWKNLRPRHDRLCFKPAVSVYGIGFHIVDDEGPTRGGFHITLEAACQRLAERGRFRDLMLMQYLPGPERSVDGLAQGGRLLRCIVRRKHSDGQWIEDHPALVETVAQLAAVFQLDGLFNAQFRDADGVPHLLEINARMSGGLPYTFRTGVNLPLWAIRLALGTATPEDIPQPSTGLWVPQPAPARSA